MVDTVISVCIVVGPAAAVIITVIFIGIAMEKIRV